MRRSQFRTGFPAACVCPSALVAGPRLGDCDFSVLDSFIYGRQHPPFDSSHLALAVSGRLKGDPLFHAFRHS